MRIIYLITNMVSGKRYVGVTKRKLAVRWQDHIRASTHGSKYPLHAALRRYGRNSFHVEEIAWPRTLTAMNAGEVAFIEKYKTLVPAGYNVTLGGDATNGIRWDANRRAKQMRTFSSKSFKRKHAAAVRKAVAQPEVQARKVATLASFYADAEKLSRIQKKAQNTPAARKHRAAAARKAHARPDVKARHRKGVIKGWLKRRKKCTATV